MSIAEELQAAMGSMGQGLEQQMTQPGLSLAVVTNVKDEEKLNRVKCLPIENENAEETDWCYVMAPMGGKQCGQFFFPNVNDLVVLGYLGGDPHRPIVLGAYWNTEVKPPYLIQDGKVHNYSIKTPSGTELLFYDEPQKQKVTLTLPSGTVLTIDDEAKSVSLKDKGGGERPDHGPPGGEPRAQGQDQTHPVRGGHHHHPGVVGEPHSEGLRHRERGGGHNGDQGHQPGGRPGGSGGGQGRQHPDPPGRGQRRPEGRDGGHQLEDRRIGEEG